ncbi:unnamed protein product [Blepharisma stoltei]|uniref:Uncharacterized protein n=1 Tax=Blepharisma stoltei TaxID=1481888 RepID=A0AAU9J049_9CILI|nr:unnamed protein product [Blepharisma stoltei]
MAQKEPPPFICLISESESGTDKSKSQSSSLRSKQKKSAASTPKKNKKSESKPKKNKSSKSVSKESKYWDELKSLEENNESNEEEEDQSDVSSYVSEEFDFSELEYLSDREEENPPKKRKKNKNKERVSSSSPSPERDEGYLLRKKYRDVGQFQCKVCDQIVPSLRAYKSHKSIRKSKCHKCKEIFLCNQQMNWHTVDCKKNPNRKWQNCGKRQYPRYLKGIEAVIRRAEKYPPVETALTDYEPYQIGFRKSYRFLDN